VNLENYPPNTHGEDGEELVEISGVLVEKSRLIDFTRDDGSAGKVLHIGVYDSPHTTAVTLWDELAEMVYRMALSTKVSLGSLRPRTEDGKAVLHSTDTTKIE
jgi:hypothetical protein